MIELGDIFRRYGPAYRAKYGNKLLPSHGQALGAIAQCRTPALGGHVYECPDCGTTEYHYHSCRNRHCPKCQNNKAQEWLKKQQELLLPVPYFLLTFTLPQGLRQLARSQQRLIYDLLFHTAAAAVQKLAQDDRFIGGQAGLVGVLHTWGRNLAYHPHVHFLAPGGGLADDQTWQPARADFFLPVKALSKIFRGKFRDALKKCDCFDQVPAAVWTQDWVVHCQPVGHGRSALKYLAPYIFRVALCNNRIERLANDQVTFRYRDSATGLEKRCTLGAEEFIRRFLQHVLPQHFVKVRYYGFLSPGQRPRLTALQQRLGAGPVEPTPATAAAEAQSDQDPTPAPERVVRCPSCGQVMPCRTLPRLRGGQPP